MSTNSNKNSSCPFCDREQSYRYIAEGKFSKIIYPKSPVIAYHTLIVPNRHEQYLDKLSNDEVVEMFSFLRTLARVGKEYIKDFIGYNLLSNNGSEAANQRVRHAHLHVFLRSKIDNDPLQSPHRSTPKTLSEQELKNMRKLREWIRMIDN